MCVDVYLLVPGQHSATSPVKHRIHADPMHVNAFSGSICVSDLLGADAVNDDGQLYQLFWQISLFPG